jgi:hypothetical protein
LVAPVTVGRGATLGAGTTLTEDAPPDKLTITRVKQTTVPGWKRPVKINDYLPHTPFPRKGVTWFAGYAPHRRSTLQPWGGNRQRTFK